MRQELTPNQPRPDHPRRGRWSWRLAAILVGAGVGIAYGLVTWWHVAHPTPPALVGEVYDGTLPTGVGVSAGESTDPAVYWIGADDAGAEHDRFAVTTFGSSSCPDAPMRMTLDGDAHLTIRMTALGGPECTADFGPSSYALELPAALRTSPRVAVTLTFAGRPAAELELARR